MQLSRRHLMQAAGASALLAGLGRNAFAQALDTVRIVNGFPAGSNPVVLARKPLSGTVAQNVQKWGCGALWIDGGRIGT